MRMLFADERTASFVREAMVSEGASGKSKVNREQLLQDFCVSRGIRLQTAKTLGWRVVCYDDSDVKMPHGCVGILLPLRGVFGGESYQIRIISDESRLEKHSRYITKPGTKTDVYTVHDCDSDTVVLCEAPIKAAILWDYANLLGVSHNIWYTTGVSQYRSKEVFSTLVSALRQRRIRRVIIAFDADDAGVSCSKDLVSMLRGEFRVNEIDYGHISTTLASAGIEQRGIDDYIVLLARRNELNSDNLIPVRRFVTMVSVADIRHQDTEFIFDPLIPCGVMSIIEGHPGSGKSFFTIGMALSVATGRKLCLGSNTLEPTRHGSVLVFACEDPPSVVRHRMQQICSGDIPSNIYYFFDPVDLRVARDEIEDIIDSYKPALVVFDPIMNYMGEGIDAHRDNAVRAVLSPYVQMANRHRCALVVVRHLRKNAQDAHAIARGIGSIAFSGLARCILAVDRDSEGTITVSVVKSSYAPLDIAISYKIEDMLV